jgi:hypothetical protein
MPINQRTRRILRYQAWIALLLFALVLFAMWASLRLADAAASGRTTPSQGELMLTFTLVVGGLSWNAIRQREAEIRSWVKVRILWQDRNWVGLFGFPLTLLVVGVVFGLTLSAWQSELVPKNAWSNSLLLALVCGLLGFCGGFGIFLPGADGLAGRRAS